MDVYSEDEGCEYEGIPKRVFNVGKIPESMDTSVPATSGLDYLRQVRYEMMRCPDLVVAKVDPKKLKPKQPLNVTTCKGITPAPEGYAPDFNWQTTQVRTFSELRQMISRKRAFYKKNPNVVPKVNLPRMNKKKSWVKFCLGNLVEVEEETDENENEFKIEEPQGPLLSIVLQLIQPNIETLLSYNIEWLQQHGFSHHQGCWVYSLLACLDKPLTPNACDLLRNLARVCANMRSKLDSSANEFLKPLNLIICLVAYYFDQRDMGDTDKVPEDEKTQEENVQEDVDDDDEEEDLDEEEEEDSSECEVD